MTTLANHRLFLSTSFPSGERGERFRPYDVGAIADAVTALVRAILRARGHLVFGAHPTISPLVLTIADEMDAPPSIEMYQSRHFAEQLPEETLRLIDRGLARVHWTERDPDGDRDRSLRVMREQMVTTAALTAALFVGGMEGVIDEYELIGRLQPAVPRLPLRAPGGAARRLPSGAHPIEEHLTEALASARYPALAHEVVATLTAPLP